MSEYTCSECRTECATMGAPCPACGSLRVVLTRILGEPSLEDEIRGAVRKKMRAHYYSQPGPADSALHNDLDIVVQAASEVLEGKLDGLSADLADLRAELLG